MKPTESLSVFKVECVPRTDFHKKNRDNIKRYQKKENRDYWWYPGENKPSDKPAIFQ